MTKIYDQHEAAFRNVSAYAILKDGTPVAKIAFKYPADGAGRLFAYVHWIGLEMTRGFAAGCGYDKHSAACSAAVAKAKDSLEVNREWPKERIDAWDSFRRELAKDNGNYWHNRLRDAGFEVFQVV